MSSASASLRCQGGAAGVLLRLVLLQWACACSGGQGGVQPAAGAGGGGAGGVGGAAIRFDSASPGVPVAVSDGGTSGMAAAGGHAGGGGGIPVYVTQNAGSAIEQADVVRFEGTRLYALSRHGGLSVIDASDSEELQVLGRDRYLEATPFDMHVRDGIVFELYYSRLRQVFNTRLDGWDSVPGASTLRVLDTRGDQVKLIRELSISGLVVGSRLVGNTLFVASTESYPNSPLTYVTSFDISSPEDPQKRDELSFPNIFRGVTLTDERMYFASYSRDTLQSTIVRVDLSSSSAKSVLGATVQVAGAVYAGWQMDEYQGVLRVVSQPYSYHFEKPARVHTFSVKPSGELVPLGTADIAAQSAELTAVHFDGARGYAINTNHNVIVFDLQDPTAPRRLDWLQSPGATIDVEAHDQRVFALSLAPKEPDGWLRLSVFDATAPVSSKPLSVVQFGGNWSAEDFDKKNLRARLNVFDADGLVLVPFAGSKPNAAAPSCTTQSSGIQVISWKDDTLTLRGLAELKGQAQLAVVHGRQLFGFSDRQAGVFDLDMNDEPQRADAVAIEQRVDKTIALGANRLLRLARDMTSKATELDVTTASDVQVPGDRQFALPPPEDRCPVDSLQLAGFADQDNVYLVMRDRFDDSSTQYRVVTLDVSDPALPSVLANATLPFTPETSFAKPAPLVDSGALVVGRGATLAFAERSAAAQDASELRYVLHVVDMTQPSAPQVSSVEIATGLGTTSLLLDDQTVATSHYERSPDDDQHVRFFMDRVDISNPGAPRLLPPINIPGSLLAIRTAEASAITVDYSAGDKEYGAENFCRDAYLYTKFDAATGSCNGLVQTLQLIQLDSSEATTLGSLQLKTYEGIAATAATDDRVFARVASLPNYSGPRVCDGGCGDRLPNLMVLGGVTDGVWQTGRLELNDGEMAGVQPIAADGQQAALWSGSQGSLVAVDGSDVASPSLLRSTRTGSVIPLDIQCIAGQAVAALGADGVMTLPLAP